jgi:hypothetical protein
MGMFGGAGGQIIRDLEMKEVQEDLKLTADEKGNIPLLKEELAEGDKKFGESLQGSSQEDMREKMTERRKEVEKQIKEVLGDKYERFHQIRLQLDGMYAAISFNKDVQDKLSVTEEQRTQLREEARPPEGSRPNFRFNAGDGPPSEEKRKEMMEEGRKMMEEMQKRQNEAVDKVLTADQKKKWEELIGAKVSYKRPQFQMQFGQGRGPGAGGTGGGGRGRRGNRGEEKGDAPPPAEEPAKKPPMMLNV